MMSEVHLAFNGTLHLRGADGYEQARVGRIFNARRPDRYPAAVLEVADIDDVYTGAAATRAYATLAAVGAIAPVVAPVLGGLLSYVMSWRGMFVTLAALALVAGIGWRAMPETLPPQRRMPLRFGPVLTGLASVLALPRFLAHVAALSAFSAVLFGYIGSSSLVLQEHFGLTARTYSVVFATNAIGLFLASNLSRFLVLRVATTRLLAVGQVLVLIGVSAVAMGVGLHSLPILLAGLCLAISSGGLIFPTATALAMGEAAGRAGSASGVIGICSFTVGAGAAAAASLGGSAWSCVGVLMVGALAGPLLWHSLLYRARVHAARTVDPPHQPPPHGNGETP